MPRRKVKGTKLTKAAQNKVVNRERKKWLSKEIERFKKARTQRQKQEPSARPLSKKFPGSDSLPLNCQKKFA